MKQIIKNLKRLRYGIFNSIGEVDKLIDETIEMSTKKQKEVKAKTKTKSRK